MSECDDLLARADGLISGDGITTWTIRESLLASCVRDLAAALRAALAARPQPDAIVQDLAHVNPRHVTAVKSLCDRARAVAAPTTSTGDDDG